MDERKTFNPRPAAAAGTTASSTRKHHTIPRHLRLGRWRHIFNLHAGITQGQVHELDMSSDGMMLFVGLEIGGTNLKAGILDGETGKLIGSFRQEPLLLPKGSLDYVGPEVCSGCCCGRLYHVVVQSIQCNCCDIRLTFLEFSMACFRKMCAHSTSSPVE